ncbi:MAG: FAD/NAD(P)-binding protein [Acetobacteraceae bacterium]
MTTIAVVGAGFSGTLLTLHLLRHCPPSTRLIMIERNNQFGRGLAYSTGNPNHFLNVPAGRMSAFHDKPNDFVEWLQRMPPAEGSEGQFTAQSFVPRRLFGAYIRALLNEEIKRSKRERLELIRGDVLTINRTLQPMVLGLDRDRAVTADLAVLAIGNFPPEPMPVADASFYDTAFYRADPWSPNALTDLDPARPVLLIGTGLTMVDAVLSLLDQGHTGPIHAVSRRGLLPRPHAAGPLPPSEHEPFPTVVTALLRFLRKEAARAATHGGGWQAIVDELRPFTVDVWQAMSLEDRRRFLRHARPWWDVHRHRMAGPVADRIDVARASGQLRITPGRIRGYNVGDSEVEVLVRPKQRDEITPIRVARVVNCSGPGADFDRIQDRLIRSLLDEGSVRPDALRLGLDVTGNCALLNRNGSISRRLFAVGPVTKGAFWEITAVPDIRRQCEKLAEYLAAIVKARPLPVPA